MTTSDFTSPVRREIFDGVMTRLSSGHNVDVGELSLDLSPDARSLVTELSVAESLGDVEVRERSSEVFDRLKVFSLEREIKKRRNVLQDINPQEEAQRYDSLFVELVGLEAERRDLLRRVQGAA